MSSTCISSLYFLGYEIFGLTPAKACFLKDNPESTEDGSEHLIVTEIPVFEDYAAMLTAGGDGYCSGVCYVSIYPHYIHFYYKKKVNIGKVNFSKKMPGGESLSQQKMLCKK